MIMIAIKTYSRKMELLNSYPIMGNKAELEKIVYSYSALVYISLNDVLSVLTEGNTTVVVGYGNSLTEALVNADIDRQKIGLVHIYFSGRDNIRFHELHKFLSDLGEDIIWGYSIDEGLDRDIKLVLLIA